LEEDSKTETSRACRTKEVLPVTASTVLLITSDSALAQTVCKLVEAIPNLCLTHTTTYEEGCRHVHRHGTALVLAHLGQGARASQVSGVLQTVAASSRPTATVVLSDQPQAEQTLALLRQGVVDCLDRPLDLHRLSYLLDALTLRARYRAPEPPLPQKAPTPTALGEINSFLYIPSTPMGRLVEQVQRVAPQQTTILLGGETGTGKTRLARLIHEISPRRDQPFLVVNCAALPENLMESEMFGHVKGAFTGADRDRAGKFAEAGRGTLFLDEIDSLPLALQAKLLRVVEERTFEPVGSNRSQPMQARLIVASNRCLQGEATAGRFRADLHYRLNVVGFFLPPLRERRGLIRPLAERLLAEFAAENGREVNGITLEALEALEAYHWPGNIRELRNVIERAVALCPGTEVQLDDVSESLRPVGQDQAVHAMAPRQSAPAPARTVTTLARTKQEAESLGIVEALKRNQNNRLRAAAELGISRMTLYKKLHRYGLMATAEA